MILSGLFVAGIMSHVMGRINGQLACICCARINDCSSILMWKVINVEENNFVCLLDMFGGIQYLGLLK
jgi:hypothetical protein